MTIEFTITGNQEDATGNAIPKIRSTRGSLWNKTSQRYAAWKEYIQLNYWRQVEGKVLAGKPFKNEKAVMDLKIYWKNRAHGDPEGVFGSIADSLWEDDHSLDGSFASQIAEDGEGRVDVEIKIKR